MLAHLLLVAAPIVSQIAGGGFHSCAVTSEGGVQCWGYNNYGQLGNGTVTSPGLVGPVSGLSSGVVSVATGELHSCALLVSGGVKCWGLNNIGQLGNGSTLSSSIPVSVTGLSSGVAAISAGSTHTCALLATGGMKCWGSNGGGQLGVGSNFVSYTPVDVAGLSGGVASIVTGLSHSCALMTTGGVKCWGSNGSGQVGNGTQESQRAAVDVLGLTSGVIAIAAGGYHTCAILAAGGAKCWGENLFGELGDGASGSVSTVPVTVSGLAGAPSALSLGRYHTCALLTTGGLQCWGYNFYGQLGTGAFTNRSVPTAVTGLAAGVLAVSAGNYFTCAQTNIGSVKCWGDDANGQIGDGAVLKSNVPVQVLGLTGADPTMTAQLITFAPPGSLTVGGTVGLAATADSGLPVSFEPWTAGTCSVSGATVNALGNGLCGIRAFQAGDGTRAAAPAVRRLIPVSGGPALTISDVTVTESSVASVNATFSVTLSPASAQTVTVQARTVGASATSGVDFSPVFPTTLTFSPGSTVAFVTVQVAPDVLDEPDETFIASLGTPVNATIARGLGTGTIVDDDPAPTLSIHDVTVAEGNVGTVNALFNVTLSAVSGKTVTVFAQTVDGTAAGGSDYVAAAPTQLTFSPGVTSRPFSVIVAGDILAEGTETFEATLGGAANATIEDGTATGTIEDDDSSGLGTPTVTAPTNGQSVIVTGVGFTWTPVVLATSYALRVQDATTGAIVFSGALSGGDSTSSLISLPAGSYTFSVRACIGDLSSPQCGASGAVAFTVNPAAPSGAPTVTFPSAGATLLTSTQTLRWSAVSPNPLLAGLTYEVLLRNVAAGQTALQIVVPSPTLSTVFTMGSSAQYELKVRACQAGCGPWSTPVTFAVDLPNAPSSAPVINSCAPTGNSLACNWGSVANADTYQVLVVQPPPAGPGGGALTAAAVQVSATNVTLPVPPGPATVLIAACNGDGCGPYATTPIDVAGLNPGAPNLGTPMAGTVVSGPTVLFTWNRIPGDSGSNTTYRLFVQDLSRQQTAFDTYTKDNFYAAYFKAEGARYDALVIANPGPSQIVGPAQGFNVAGLSATAPTMVSPAHNSTVPSGNVQLGWSPVPGATLYEYFVAVLGQPDATARGVTPGLLTQVPLTGSGLGTVYSGIVRACPAGATCVAGVDAGWGPWSNVGGPGVTNFTVVP